jgi:radial spoke head protein 4A
VWDINPSGFFFFFAQIGDSTTIIVNPEYEGLANETLLELSNWVHHVPHILPQGRTQYTKPELIRDEDDGRGSGRRGEDDDGDDEEEGDREEDGEEDAEEDVEPESGPALLTAISEDEGALRARISHLRFIFSFLF